jgi:AcrR family transcriptional regulator
MPPSTVTTAPGRQRFSDDELLDAALGLFHARGYHVLQMNDLAVAANTSKPTLYARLGSKEEIYIRVLEREAGLLQSALYAEYARASNAPLGEVVEIAMLAFFRFAQARRAGFDLLFRSEPGGPGHGIGERSMDEVIDHVAQLIDTYIVRSGHQPGSRTPLLAAAGVGAARQVCQYALDTGDDLDKAGALVTAFATAAIRLIDVEMLPELDVRREDEGE